MVSMTDFFYGLNYPSVRFSLILRLSMVFLLVAIK